MSAAPPKPKTAPYPAVHSTTPPTIPSSVKRLQDILNDDNVFHCSGTVSIQPQEAILYYGLAPPGRIDLLNATASELDQLQEACHPATFGVNQEDVLDESYRRAGKLDLGSFALGFHPENAGLVDALRGGLFSGKDEDRLIRAEAYKLNVYGKDAFFKSHKDTPRAENMFGSLVVVFPTPHEGGALALRHGGREWTFDSGKMLSDPDLPPSVAFVAFFSDVDHEVTPVITGHRVSLTYNLYFRPVPGGQGNAIPPALRLRQPRAADMSQVSSALTELLADPAFLSEGGTLGFGLRHQYPLPRTWGEGDPNPLTALEGWLKGADAALLRACQSFGLRPRLFLLYEDVEEPGSERMWWIRSTVLDHVPVIDWASEESNDHILTTMFGATRLFRVNLFEEKREYGYYGQPPGSWAHTAPDNDGVDYPYVTRGGWGRDGRVTVRSVTVHMLTEVSNVNRINTTFLAYGNEAGTNLVYMSVCMLVDIGPAGKRDEVEPGRWATEKAD